MKPNKQPAQPLDLSTSLGNISRRALLKRLSLGSLGLYLGAKSLRADTETLTCPDCVMRPWPTNRLPLIEEIPFEFQPLDPHRLEWRKFTPSTNPPWPTVVVLHEGEFEGGSPFGQAIQRMVAPDLNAAGYYVLVPSWRLAPCGRITNQQCHDNTPEGKMSGRPPQQSDDVKAIIRAARAETNCLGQKVGVVGGSAGATHAVWVALDTNSSGSVWPFWTTNDRADVACCLSGAYLFSERRTELYTPAIDFPGIIHNYTGTTNTTTQENLSPTKLVKPDSVEFPFKPTLLIDTERDSMPHFQILDMEEALEAVGLEEGVDFRRITIDDTGGHAFEYWDNFDTETPPKLISQEVIDYLDAVLKP
jgi:acetyl esterase/lipase